MNGSSNPISWQASFDDLGRHLSETTFVVVDLETTGGSPGVNVITEIGAQKVRGGKVIGEFQTLVNPGVPIPPFITVLTGITEAMLLPAPRIDEAFPQLLEFFGSESETVLVAHNAPFDIGFLKAAAAGLGYTFPKYQVLDTVKIARQVLTKDEVRNYKLETLSQFFRTETTPTHRALDDVRATVSVLHGLIERLGSFGIFTLEELKEFSNRITKAQAAKKHLAANIPASPGVYIFKDAKGDPLYVGTSKNLRARVRTYFTAGETRKRIREMIWEQVEVLADQVEDAMRAVGPEVPSSAVGLEVLDRLRALDEVAYLRFASVYKGFDDAADFQRELRLLQKLQTR